MISKTIPIIAIFSRDNDQQNHWDNGVLTIFRHTHLAMFSEAQWFVWDPGPWRLCMRWTVWSEITGPGCGNGQSFRWGEKHRKAVLGIISLGYFRVKQQRVLQRVLLQSLQSTTIWIFVESGFLCYSIRRHFMQFFFKGQIKSQSREECFVSDSVLQATVCIQKLAISSNAFVCFHISFHY